MNKTIEPQIFKCYTNALDFEGNLKTLREYLEKEDIVQIKGLSKKKILKELKVLEEIITKDRKILAVLYKILRDERSIDERNSNGKLSSNKKVQS